MYKLYGIITEHDKYYDGLPSLPKISYDYIKSKVLIAKFVFKQDAERYVKISKLKTYKKICTGNCYKQFRATSLLHGYCDYIIEQEELLEDVPIDPEI